MRSGAVATTPGREAAGQQVLHDEAADAQEGEQAPLPEPGGELEMQVGDVEGAGERERHGADQRRADAEVVDQHQGVFAVADPADRGEGSG